MWPEDADGACYRWAMPDDLREQLLASYPDVGPAMIAQSVLESGGVPCRIYDLAGLPPQVFGMMGAHARPVGLWVLDVNAERAAAMLAAAGADGAVVDEDALAAEALAAAPAEIAAPPAATEVIAAREPSTRSGAGQRSGRAVVVLAVIAVMGAVIAYLFG